MKKETDIYTQFVEPAIEAAETVLTRKVGAHESFTQVIDFTRHAPKEAMPPNFTSTFYKVAYELPTAPSVRTAWGNAAQLSANPQILTLPKYDTTIRQPSGFMESSRFVFLKAPVISAENRDHNRFALFIVEQVLETPDGTLTANVPALFGYADLDSEELHCFRFNDDDELVAIDPRTHDHLTHELSKQAETCTKAGNYPLESVLFDTASFYRPGVVKLSDEHAHVSSPHVDELTPGRSSA